MLPPSSSSESLKKKADRRDFWVKMTDTGYLGEPQQTVPAKEGTWGWGEMGDGE